MFTESANRNNIHMLSVVTESNLVSIYQQVLESNTGLSMLSQRLLRIVISLIDPKQLVDPDILAYPFYFTVADYQRVFNINYYPKEELERLAQELSRRITIQDPFNSNHSITTGLINDVEVNDGTVKVTVPSYIIPALQAASSRYQLGNTTRFSNSSSFLLYERLVLLMETSDDENYFEFKIELATLKEWFAIKDKYRDKNGNFTYGPFKKKILLKAIDDINKVDTSGNPVCNINIGISEAKIGKRIAFVTFKITRVHDDHYYQTNKPVLNSFRNSLSTDLQTIYDFLLNLNFVRQEVETAIVRFPMEKLKEICSYMQSKKLMGRAYLAAILRNGWTGKEKISTDKINLDKLDKVITFNPIQSNILLAFYEFLLIQTPKIQQEILRLTLEEFETTQPELYAYYKDIPLEAILSSDNTNVFIAEKAEALTKAQYPELYKEFTRFLARRQNTNTPNASNNHKKALPIGREAIISKLKSYHIVEANALIELLKFSDEHIHANIKYCQEKYPNKADRELTSLIVAAIQRDFCQFELKAHEEKLKQKKATTTKQLCNELKKMLLADVQDLAQTATEPLFKELAKEELERRDSQVKIITQQEEDAAFHKFVDSQTDNELIATFNSIISSNPLDFRVQLMKNLISKEKLQESSMHDLLKGKPMLWNLFKDLWKKSST